MLLKSIKVCNIGSFRSKCTIPIEDGVTYITGRNDVGKSTVLRCIALMCRDDQARDLQESEINNEHHYIATKTWDVDPTVGCDAIFEFTARSKLYADNKRLAIGQHLHVRCQLAPRAFSRQVTEVHGNDGSIISTPNISLQKSPLSIYFPRNPDLPIRDRFPSNSPHIAEQEFLELAFGSPYEHTRWQSMTPIKRRTALTRANEELSFKFARLFPRHSDMRIHLATNDSTDSLEFFPQVIDKNHAYTAFGQRGAGVQKLLRLFGVLSRIPDYAGHVYVLADEPENSLHPDAQHLYRSLLEDIAQLPHVQVIIATHSPAMLNPLFPEAIRLLERTVDTVDSETVLVDRPSDDGFYGVRVSLGISVADVLNLAPVTLIVEGASESLGIPMIIRRLVHQSDFTQSNWRVFDQCRIWDASGDDFDKCCGWAKSRGLKPIAWLNGDKRDKIVARQKRPFTSTMSIL